MRKQEERRMQKRPEQRREERRGEEGRGGEGGGGRGARRGVWLPCETAPSCESLSCCGVLHPRVTLTITYTHHYP